MINKNKNIVNPKDHKTILFLYILKNAATIIRDPKDINKN